MYTIKGETDHKPRLDAWDKRSDLVHWEDLEGAGGEGGGRGDRDGEDMWTQGRFISMYEKNKNKNKIKKKKRKENQATTGGLHFTHQLASQKFAQIYWGFRCKIGFW